MRRAELARGEHLVVFDPIGGDAGEQALRFMANESRFLAAGFASGRWPAIDYGRPSWGTSRCSASTRARTDAYGRADNEHDHEEALEAA